MSMIGILTSQRLLDRKDTASLADAEDTSAGLACDEILTGVEKGGVGGCEVPTGREGL
jgi:hypothetical protein